MSEQGLGYFAAGAVEVEQVDVLFELGHVRCRVLAEFMEKLEFLFVAEVVPLVRKQHEFPQLR